MTISTRSVYKSIYLLVLLLSFGIAVFRFVQLTEVLPFYYWSFPIPDSTQPPPPPTQLTDRFLLPLELISTLLLFFAMILYTIHTNLPLEIYRRIAHLSQSFDKQQPDSHFINFPQQPNALFSAMNSGYPSNSNFPTSTPVHISNQTYPINDTSSFTTMSIDHHHHLASPERSFTSHSPPSTSASDSLLTPSYSNITEAFLTPDPLTPFFKYNPDLYDFLKRYHQSGLDSTTSYGSRSARFLATIAASLLCAAAIIRASLEVVLLPMQVHQGSSTKEFVQLIATYIVFGLEWALPFLTFFILWKNDPLKIPHLPLIVTTPGYSIFEDLANPGGGNGDFLQQTEQFFLPASETASRQSVQSPSTHEINKNGSLITSQQPSHQQQILPGSHNTNQHSSLPFSLGTSTSSTNTNTTLPTTNSTLSNSTTNRNFPHSLQPQPSPQAYTQAVQQPPDFNQHLTYEQQQTTSSGPISMNSSPNATAPNLRTAQPNSQRGYTFNARQSISGQIKASKKQQQSLPQPGSIAGASGGV